VSEEELAALMEKYKRVAGFEREALKKRASLVLSLSGRSQRHGCTA